MVPTFYSPHWTSDELVNSGTNGGQASISLRCHITEETLKKKIKNDPEKTNDREGMDTICNQQHKDFFFQKQYQNHKHGDEWSLHHVNDSVRESAVFYNVWVRGLPASRSVVRNEQCISDQIPINRPSRPACAQRSMFLLNYDKSAEFV